jgi:CBS domain-containing protein
LSILDLGSPPARFAWLSVKVKKEQLLLTDQDSILILKMLPQINIESKDYFIKLGKDNCA